MSLFTHFDKCSQTILEAIKTDKLELKSIINGEVVEATDEDTLIAGDEIGKIDVFNKYKYTIRVTPYDPVNPAIRLNDGCQNCGRKIVKFQRLGDEKIVIYCCLCGNSWSNYNKLT